jgi:hypothetical protein
MAQRRLRDPDRSRMVVFRGRGRRLLAGAALQAKEGVAVPIGPGDFPSDCGQGSIFGTLPFEAVRQRGGAMSLVLPDPEELRAGLYPRRGEQVILVTVSHRW